MKVTISLFLARKLWKQYFAKVDGIIFIVDAEDKERFPEAKKELSVCFLLKYNMDRSCLPRRSWPMFPSLFSVTRLICLMLPLSLSFASS